MQLRTRTGARSAFTLIELLVVITIIIIIMGLLMAAVTKIFVLVDEAKTTTELSVIDQGLESLRTSLGRYPPSRIRLIEQPTAAVYYASGNAFDMFSVDALRGMFPGIYITIDQPSGTNPAHTHDWNGDTAATAGAEFTLQGDECLVFFLGGIPTIDAAGVIAGQGFCTDKTNPTLPTPGRARIGPFFEFKTDRFVIDSTRRVGNRFAVYRDVWGTPYAYFASRYATANSYPSALSNPAQPSDCPTLTGIFVPYWQTRTGAAPNFFHKFHRADKFQIISAGRDQQFFTPVPGYPIAAVSGRFDPSNPEQYLTAPERDNMTNFHSGLLAPR